jgi:hypothetical protein
MDLLVVVYGDITSILLKRHERLFSFPFIYTVKNHPATSTRDPVFLFIIRPITGPESSEVE